MQERDDRAERRMPVQQTSCLSARVQECNQADEILDAPPRSPERTQLALQCNALPLPFQTKLLHGGNTHQNPVPHRPSPNSNYHYHPQGSCKSINASLFVHEKCSFKSQLTGIWPPPLCTRARCHACPSTRSSKHSFATFSPTLEIVLTARNEVIFLPIGPPRVGEEAYGGRGGHRCEERAAAPW